MNRPRIILILIGLVLLVTLALLTNGLWGKPGQTTTTDATSGITKDQALAAIESRNEVKEYQKMLTEAGKNAEIEVENGDGEWSVHVFEIVKNDRDGSSHTATFGWYRVDKKTGTVEKEI